MTVKLVWNQIEKKNFKSLKQGEAFITDGRLFMKTREIQDGDTIANAVEIDGGGLHRLLNEPVEPVDIVVTINHRG